MNKAYKFRLYPSPEKATRIRMMFKKSILKQSLNEGIGIDSGLTNFAICSDGTSFKNLNRSSAIRKVEKRLKRKQCSLSQNMKIKSEVNNLLLLRKKHSKKCD